MTENQIRQAVTNGTLVNWTNVSVHQHLSEPFLREFAEKVNWTNVSMYQRLSEDFIREFA